VRPVSDGFLRTLRGSHSAVARARVCPPGQTGTDPDGTEIPIEGGDIVFDATAQVRGTVELLTDGTRRWPHDTADLLAPYGNELFIEKGIRYGNGTTEWVSQGYFRIEDLDQDDVPDGAIAISASDRMQGVIDAKLLKPAPYGSATPIGVIIDDLINGFRRVYPTWNVVIEWDDNTDDTLTTRVTIADEDRYKYIDDIVTAHGKIWYFDHRGHLLIRDVPDPGNTVWQVNAGRDGVLVGMRRNLTRKRIYNGVTAYGEATDNTPPALAYAVDMDTESPTYWYGSFGFSTRRYFSPFIQTNAQAFAAASKILMQSLGAPYNVDFQSITNAALEVFDPIELGYPYHSRALSNRVEPHVIEQLRVPLVDDRPITATAREQKPGSIGAPDL
jgi:hypothetical protein